MSYPLVCGFVPVLRTRLATYCAEPCALPAAAVARCPRLTRDVHRVACARNTSMTATSDPSSAAAHSTMKNGAGGGKGSHGNGASGLGGGCVGALRSISRAVDSGMQRAFFKLGWAVASRPWTVVIIMCIVTAACATGMTQTESEARSEIVWNPENSCVLWPCPRTPSRAHTRAAVLFAAPHPHPTPATPMLRPLPSTLRCLHAMCCRVLRVCAAVRVAALVRALRRRSFQHMRLWHHGRF